MPKKGKAKKRVRIGTYVYCSPEEKKLIQRAARKVRRKVSNYILAAVLCKAQSDLGLLPAR